MILFALQAMLLLAPATSQPTGPSPPNVVLIIGDDQGWTDFGFMGHPHIRTPRLDQLAVQSLTFRRGYVPSSLCSPSLATILTGLYPHQHGIVSNDPPRPDGPRTPATKRAPALQAAREQMLKAFDEMPSLPRLLAEKDYLSLQTGKWWGGNFKRGGFSHGMSHGKPDQGGRHGDAGLAIGRETMQPIYDFIAEASKERKPFLIWYAPFLPHSPHNPPERLLAHYRELAPTLEVAKYWAMCEWFDETCGQLLDHLDEQGLKENTLVLFVTDNGWIQDPKVDRFGPRSKQSPYDGGLRTPIMIRWPGKVEPGFCDVPVTSVDIAPTILKAAGLQPDPRLQGLNLLDNKAIQARNAIFGEVFTHDAVKLNDPASSLRFRWIVSDGWKLIIPNKRNEPSSAVELFHVAQDSFEEKNQAEDQTERVRDLSKRLDAWWPG